MEDFINMNVRNEIKAQIIRTGMTMQEVVDLLSDEYGWSDSVSNLSAKLQRESIRYKEYTLLVPDSTNAVYAWATRGADLSTKASIKATWTSMSTGEASNTTLISGSSSGKNLSGFNIASAESNTLTITVTDDGSTDVYTVKTVRIDPSLTKLALDGVKVNETFSATKKTYTAMTTKDSVTVLATPRGEDYTVTYNGETSNVIPLSTGENKIEIVVTNKDGYTNSYNLTVTKADHAVTIPTDESYLVTGKEAVMDGADYTFSKTDKDESHYEYTNVKATVNDENVAVIDNGDGTYTVKNVTGDLTVTGKRTAKQYPITVDGNAKGCIRVADTVPYGTDYDFTAEELEPDQYD